jgi:hypothetical protein
MRQTLKHKGVTFHVEPSLKEGHFDYQFTIGDKTTRGKKRAKLVDLAIRRVQLLIDVKLRERPKK